MLIHILVSESYITHIRIIEDAAFPSSPPPVQSPPENKKPRVIVVAVRKSGRVRVHKARENSNSSFSIGKTWNLDDLTGIESYTNSIPTNAEEQQNKERAGGIGFLVTIQKPYYWQASTTKEKDFFIYSMIKIYKKYTGGKLPQLSGFDPQEIEQLAGVGGPQPGAQPTTFPNSMPRTEPAQGPIRQREIRPQPNSQLSQQSSRDPRLRPQERSSQEHSTQERSGQKRPSQERPLQDKKPQGLAAEQPSRGHRSQERTLRAVESDDRMRRMPGQFPSSDVVRSLKPQTSQTQFQTQKLEPSGDQPIATNGSLQSESYVRPPNGAQSVERFQDGPTTHMRRSPQPSPRPSGEVSRQNGSYAAASRTGAPPEQRSITPEDRHIPLGLRAGRQPLSPAAQTQIPERIRPPLVDRELNLSQRDASTSSRNVSNAHSTPDLTEDRFRSPSLLSNNQISSSHPSSAIDQPSGIQGDSRRRTATQAETHLNGTALIDGSSPASKLNGSISRTTDSITTDSPILPPETPAEAEQHRPGLGPMIKKKPNAEVASKFRKAATAYNAFKPRAGSAAERIQQEKEKAAGEADGITGVFPAPSLLRGKGPDTLKSPTINESDVEQPVPLGIKKEPPTVQITTSPPEHVVPIITPIPQLENTPPDEPPPIPGKVSDEVRRKRKSDHSVKYAKIVGINPSLLEGRTSEIETVLNDFGWGENNTDRNTFEELQSGLRKELARIEAGSWLGTVESNDERVATTGEMMDKVVAECEELDGLLTLYNVELGVSSLIQRVQIWLMLHRL